MKILQVGLGNFGKRHLEAWHRLGLGDHLWIAEPDQQRWDLARQYGLPGDRCVRSASEALQQVEIVDIVTPTEHHADLMQQALEAGKDVFVEKPMTMTSGDARRLVESADRLGRRIQVGYYYRFHPIAERLKAEISAGRLGAIRYLTGDFCGFKRARTDVGVTHTDGIHFLDLFNWLLDATPVDVFAVCRDHFGRQLEDFSIVLLTYPGGTVAKVESGYIQPGRWPDKVVDGAMTTKEITVVGETATAEVDFEAETFTITDVHHELRNGIWTPVRAEPTRIQVESCDPVQLVCRELEAFLTSVQHRGPTAAGPIDCGVNLAVLMECLYASADRHEAVRIDLSLPVGSRSRA